MSLLKKLIVSLPEKTQDALMSRLMKSGAIFKTPVWEMLFRTIDFIGVDTVSLKQGFARMCSEDLDVVTLLRLMGHEQRAIAEQAERAGDLDAAREAYMAAGGYYLLPDFFHFHPDEEQTSYYLAQPCYDRFRALSLPPIEKVSIPYQKGAIKAYLHLPEGEGPFPAVVFTQGNEGVKEAMTHWAEIANARGIAVLNGEPPGWGESGLSGTWLRGPEDLAAYGRLSVDFLQGRSDILPDKIGIFGVSYGGFTSLYCAGKEQRFAATGGIGGPFLDVNRARNQALAMQRRKSHKVSGAKTDDEHSRIMDALEPEIVLQQVRCPALIIHGSEDLLINGWETNHQLSAAVSGGVTSWVIEGGDHMCSQFLAEGLVDRVFDWYADQLG